MAGQGRHRGRAGWAVLAGRAGAPGLPGEVPERLYLPLPAAGGSCRTGRTPLASDEAGAGPLTAREGPQGRFTVRAGLWCLRGAVVSKGCRGVPRPSGLVISGSPEG